MIIKLKRMQHLCSLIMLIFTSCSFFDKPYKIGKKANKVMNNKGRLLIRKSGTEPKIRIMGESHDKHLILQCIKIIKRSIKK